MKYEEYIMAIAPFEDFKSRADKCNDNAFRNKLMKAYDKGLREIGRKILIENNITPNKLINQECTPMTFEPISARIDVNNEVILIGYLHIYNKRKNDVITITDAMSLMIPYAIAFTILWLVIILAFYIIGIPIGIGTWVML